jgi:hypothetical protein
MVPILERAMTTGFLITTGDKFAYVRQHVITEQTLQTLLGITNLDAYVGYGSPHFTVWAPDWYTPDVESLVNREYKPTTKGVIILKSGVGRATFGHLELVLSKAKTPGGTMEDLQRMMIISIYQALKTEDGKIE